MKSWRRSMTAFPRSWISTSVDSVTLPVFKINQSGSPDDVIRYIDISSIDNVNFRISDHKKYVLHEAPSRARQIIQTGDVLFSTVRPYLKNIAQVTKKYDGEIASTGFSVLRPATGLDQKYLYFCAIYRDFVNSLSEDQYGVSYPAVKDNQVREKLIPLPPADEQHRIVAKIEELFSELDNGIESLKKAREQLKVYRQALLKHAFEGKLTEQWRAENADNLDSEAELQKRIKQEREARYQQQLEAWKATVNRWEADGKEGKKPSRPRKPKQIEAITGEESLLLFNLAESHSWQRFGNIYYESVLGKMLDKNKNKGELKPYLRNINVRWGSFDLSDILEMRFEESELPRYTVSKGDLVICEGGAPGRCSVWNQEEQGFLIQKALHRVRLIEEEMSPEHIQYFIKFSAEQGMLSNYFTGTTIKHLTGASLAKLPIPLMPIEEQLLIVAHLDEQSSYCDQLDSDLEDNIGKSEALRQSILKKAFSGQLVPQDPNDEPASLLLDRIAKEKQEAAAKAKKAKAAKKKPKINRTSTRKAS